MYRNSERLNWIRKQNETPETEPKINIGKNCNIHPTVVLGESGVGMERDENNEWVRCNQHGDVDIEDNVQIGSFCNIKRASIAAKSTVIGKGSILATYVNVGHNCKIGKNVFILPYVLLNGSVEIGDGAWIAGHAIIEQHARIGPNAVVGMGSIVKASRTGDWDVKPGETVVGAPATPIKFVGNYVHPSFKYGKNLKIGKYNDIQEDVTVGDDVTIKSYVELRKDTIIGNNCYVDSGVKSSGQCKIGNNVILRYDAIIARNVIIEDDVFIAPQVMFINIPFVDKEKKTTVIKKGAKIGTNSTIDDGVTVGEGVIIGAKSFVNKDCIEKGIYAGSPVKLMKAI
jgi:UDP-2-acetamido-3-amino-2,3-dideoxy-glucuronate N-acetyltransferase